MSGRWVCQRCYESNDADATACSRCGLERGADPSQAADTTDASNASTGGGQWSPVAKQDTRPGWLSFLLRFGWVGVVIVIALVGVALNARRDDSGQISTGGNLQIQDLRIGDCFNLKDEDADSVSDVDAKPCAETHRYELYHATSMPEGDYPSDAALSSFAEEECVGAFQAYIGLPPQDSALRVTYFTPSSDAWDDGDRSVQCAAYDPDAESRTGTLKGAAR
jgi:hypothetical protein